MASSAFEKWVEAIQFIFSSLDNFENPEILLGILSII
jgi:hypothetical protein